MPVIYITVFEEDLKWGNIVGWGCRCGCGVIIIRFKIGLFNLVDVFDVFFSFFLFIETYSVSLIWSFYFFFCDLFCLQYFLDFHRYPKGSCKMGSVCPSVLASVLHSRRFLEIVSLVISKFWHDARNPDEVVCDGWIFWKKTCCHKIWGNEAKMGQNRAFWIYWKIWSLNFSEFVL